MEKLEKIKGKEIKGIVLDDFNEQVQNYQTIVVLTEDCEIRCSYDGYNVEVAPLSRKVEVTELQDGIDASDLEYAQHTLRCETISLLEWQVNPLLSSSQWSVLRLQTEEGSTIHFDTELVGGYDSIIRVHGLLSNGVIL